MIIFYSLIETVSVVGNFIVLFVVYKSKKLRHSQYVYNCSIAISDIMWAFSICTFFVTYCWEIFDLNEVIIEEVRNYSSKPRVTKEENNKTTYVYHLDYVEVFRRQGPFCNFSMYLAQYLAPITLFVSFISLVFAAADRYVALTFPFRYKQMNSTKIAKIASFFTWLISAIIHTATLFQSHYPYSV